MFYREKRDEKPNNLNDRLKNSGIVQAIYRVVLRNLARNYLYESIFVEKNGTAVN